MTLESIGLWPIYLAAYLWLSVCVAVAASKYAANWLFLATFFSPLAAEALLFACRALRSAPMTS